MTDYYIVRPCFRVERLNATDLLTAVKISRDFEEDLYEDGELICSWLRLSMENNINKLHEKGIKTYILKDRYCFKWIDESKNIEQYYVHFHRFIWDGKHQLQVFVHDYRSGDYEVEFSSLNDVYSYIRNNYRCINEENVRLAIFDDEGYKGLKLPELKVAI